jgi:hypothetical protein
MQWAALERKRIRRTGVSNQQLLPASWICRWIGCALLAPLSLAAPVFRLGCSLPPRGLQAVRPSCGGSAALPLNFSLTCLPAAMLMFFFPICPPVRWQRGPPVLRQLRLAGAVRWRPLQTSRLHPSLASSTCWRRCTSTPACHGERHHRGRSQRCYSFNLFRRQQWELWQLVMVRWFKKADRLSGDCLQGFPDDRVQLYLVTSYLQKAAADS